MEHSSYFPLFVDMSGKKIMFFGGGRVATRRIGVLQPFAENITVVSPDISPHLEELVRNDLILWKKKKYEEADLSGADMVFAATGDAGTDRRIAEDCGKCGILVNAASDRDLCDFFFPAIVERGQTVIGINGSGMDHSGVKEIRIRIEEALAEKCRQERDQDWDGRHKR